MCLKIANNWEEELHEFINGREAITVYKIIEEDKSSVYNPFIWKKGLNESSRADTNLTSDELESMEIRLGFHFYIKEDIESCTSAKSKLGVCLRRCPYPPPYRCPRRYRLIKLTINSKDLVAVGKFNGLDSCVATKATWDGEFVEL